MIDEMTEQCRYHTEILQNIKKTSTLLLTCPSQAYSQIVIFKKHDLEKILQLDANQVKLMYVCIENILSNHAVKSLPRYKELKK